MVVLDDAAWVQTARAEVGELLGDRPGRVTVAAITRRSSVWVAFAPVHPYELHAQSLSAAGQVARLMCRQLPVGVAATHLVLADPSWTDVQQLAERQFADVIVLCVSRRRQRRRLLRRPRLQRNPRRRSALDQSLAR